MENDLSLERASPAKTAAITIRETLLKVCRHYQEPGLGKEYLTAARYYEKQIEKIPTLQSGAPRSARKP